MISKRGGGNTILDAIYKLDPMRQQNKTLDQGCGSPFILPPDSHSEKLLDPDPHKLNADPQP